MQYIQPEKLLLVRLWLDVLQLHAVLSLHTHTAPPSLQSSLSLLSESCNRIIPLCVCVWFTGSELMFVIKEQKKDKLEKKRQKSRCCC